MFDLILEETDPETLCISSLDRITVNNISELIQSIDLDLSDDPGLEYDYEIDPIGMAALKTRYELNCITGKMAGILRKVQFYDLLPYQSHNGRELCLMLDGKKPLSFFAEMIGDTTGVFDRVHEKFEPYVENGRILASGFELTSKTPEVEGVRYRVYALPQHDWRIKALYTLKSAGWKSGWSEGLERMECELLGYEDWQTDLYLQSQSLR